MSSESRKKISDSLKGNHYALGFKHSDETKRKVSIASKKQDHSWKIGRKPNEETRKKMGLAHKGHNGYWADKIRENSPNWRGGINPENDNIRKSKESKLWIKACLERDNFTCQKTGQIGGKLQVHHINNFAQFIELRFALDNGITFSKETHKEFHRIYGIKNNTRQQLEEFLHN